MEIEAVQALADVLNKAMLVAIVMLSALAAMLLLLAAASRFVAQVHDVLAERRQIHCLTGTLYIAAVAAMILLLSGLGEVGFIMTLLVGAVSVAFALLGLAVMSQRMGRRIGHLHGGAEWSDLVSFLAGGTAVLFAALVPFLGWVLLFYFTASGLGAVLHVISVSAIGMAARRRETTR